MKQSPTFIGGVHVVDTNVIHDHRGEFARLFCERELSKIVGKRRIVQANFSRTLAAGAVRGFHFQHPPYAEMKFVRCLKGRVWDVAVDLRKDSPTFLQWHAEELSAENGRMLVIPEGCAHGFQALQGDSELLYLHTAFYVSEAEDGVPHNDSALAVTWPLPPADLSERDRRHPEISSEFTGLVV
jgi:dTDP-4-dehydrorhamnose 3,5-epimerase